MTRDHAPPIPRAGPIAGMGHATIATLVYLGGLAILVGSIPAGLFWPRRRVPAAWPALVRQWDWLFMTGLPLVALTHVGLGSFLAMQAFFGATFMEGVGPVVAVGLIRNMAPLMTGFVLAGLAATRHVVELRGTPHASLEDPEWVPDREVVLGRRDDPREPPEPARLAAIRILAATVAGPFLVLWGSVAGVGVGCLVSHLFLGVPYTIFFGKATEMLWERDVVGLVAKGAGFALIAAALACFEGLREGPSDARSVRLATFRAACVATVFILVFNNAWFLLVYHAGPAFGPTVLATPPR